MTTPDFATIAETQHRAVVEQFYLPEHDLYREWIPVQPEDTPFSTLWPFTGVIGGLNALAALPDRGAAYHDALRRTLAMLRHYHDADAPIPAYDSYVRSEGGGHKFYDDNEWIGLEFLEAAHTLGEPAWIEAARTIFDFAYTGFAPEPGESEVGGIYWRENYTESKNTCSTGPAALLALRLYQHTHEAIYLDRARGLLKWLERLRTPGDVYWDAVREDGTIDERLYTYNTGTPLHSFVVLYQITGEQHALQQAQALARGALATFAPLNAETGVRHYPDIPWFNGVLLRGFLALYAQDGDPTYVESVRASLAYAWEHARGDDGFISVNGIQKTDAKLSRRQILDQAAMVELYARMAAVPEQTNPVGEGGGQQRSLPI